MGAVNKGYPEYWLIVIINPGWKAELMLLSDRMLDMEFLLQPVAYGFQAFFNLYSWILNIPGGGLGKDI